MTTRKLGPTNSQSPAARPTISAGGARIGGQRDEEDFDVKP